MTKPVNRARLSISSAKSKAYVKSEPVRPGLYRAKVDNIRVGPDRQGLGFHIDYEIVEVLEEFSRPEAKGGGTWPTSRVGSKGHFCVYPENVTPGKLSREDLIALEQGKIQAAVGAVMGYHANDLDFLDDDVLDSAVAYFEKERPCTYNSPLAERTFIVRGVPHVSKYGKNAGKDTAYAELEPDADLAPLPRGPVTGGAAPKAAPAAATASEPPAPPVDDAPEPPPATSFEERAAAAGWADRAPQYPGWWYHAESKRQLKRDALEAELG